VALGERKEGRIVAVKIPQPPSEGEETLALHIRAEKLPPPEREFAFCAERKWRFDFAWSRIKVGVEVEGGTWVSGRHARGEGYRRDCEKYNAAQLMGWKVLRFTTEMVADGTAVRVLRGVLVGIS
jgi:very-short-patch-repair endonuclease